MPTTVAANPNPLPRIHDALAARGLTLPPPQATPEPLGDVTLLDPVALGRAMSHYAALIAYVATEEAVASARAKDLASRYRHARALRYLEAKAEEPKRSDRYVDAILDADPELDALRQQEYGAEAYARLLRALQTGHENAYSLLSREITRRTLDSDRALG